MKDLNVAVIGVGQMGYYHSLIYKDMTGVNLYAICEYNDDRRESIAKEFSCKAYKDYRELLENPEIDAVSIVLPDNMHREAVEIAIENKKHILLEKPLCKELEDGKAVIKAAQGYDKVFSIGFLLRYDYRFNSLKKKLDDGELGDIVHLYARRNSPIIGPRRYIGASNLSMHVMSHDIDYANWFIGDIPKKVFAKGRSVLLKEYDMDDVIYAILTYPNGELVCLEACWTLPENSPTIIDDKVELVGTKGVAYIDSCDQGIKFITDKNIEYPDSRHWYYVNNQIKGDLADEVHAFVDCIVNDKKPLVTAEDGYNSLLVVDAIERSLESGEEITL